MDPLMRIFHDVSPYEGHDLAAHPQDMQGWGSADPLFERVIGALRPQLIVEVGTWKGASAIHMARVARNLGLSSRIICIDTWLGSAEHIVDDQWRPSLRLKNGYPQLYFTFLTNVIASELTDVIIPLPIDTGNAARLLEVRGIRPDLVYLDGAHDYASVLNDLLRYWKLLKDTGVLIGDDYVNWPEVTSAANDFAKQIGRPIVGCPGKFVISKNPRIQPVINIASG